MSLVAPFTSPVNGPFLDANTIRGNDNTLGALLNIATYGTANVMAPPFNAKGDGVTDDSGAWRAALAAAPIALVPVPPVSYYLAQPVPIPVNQIIRGASKWAARVTCGVAGDLFPMGDGAALEHLSIDGNASLFSARGAVMSGGEGHQAIRHCRLVNFDGACISFDVGAGSQFLADDCELWRFNGIAGREAVVIEDVLTLAAVPRTFRDTQTAGQYLISLGGASDLFIRGGFIGGMTYSTNSRAVQLNNARWGNQASVNLKGANHTITGCDIYPQITLVSGTDNCAIGDNSYNQSPAVIDNSGNTRNTIENRALSASSVSTALLLNAAPPVGAALLAGNAVVSGTDLVYYDSTGARRKITGTPF